MGLEIGGLPKISNVSSQSEYTSIKIDVLVNDPSQVKKYIYELSDGQKIESESNTVTFTNLTIDARYTLKIKALLFDGFEISKYELLSTKSIEGKIEFTRSETEITANDVEVELVYENEMPDGYELQYKVTRTESEETILVEDWTKYTQKIIINKSNIKITARLYNNNLEDEKLGTSLIISNIDKEPPIAPIINSKFSYPILSEYGVKVDGSTTITYDSKEGLKNLYSVDGGKTWKEYTGEFNLTGNGTIMAKSIKPNKLETVTSKNIEIPEDALTSDCYDANIETYVEIKAGIKKMYVDESMWGENINIHADFYAYNATDCYEYVKFYNSSGKVLKTYKYTSTQKINEKFLVPENTEYICFESDLHPSFYTRIYEIGIY